MLELTYGNTDEEIVVTLNELKTLDEPNFLFIFIHTLTKTRVAFVKLNGDDQSADVSRYNLFLLDTATLFLNKPIGEWLYSVYEQASTTNTDESLATSLLEQGKMLLYRTTDFEFEKYDEPVTYKTYNG